MRLNELIESQATTVFLNTDQFAEEVTHRPLGDDARDAAVIANVVWEQTAENQDGGVGNRLKGQLDVAGELAVDPTDRWVIDGEEYQTLTVGNPQGGLRQVTVQRITTQRRTKARSVL